MINGVFLVIIIGAWASYRLGCWWDSLTTTIDENGSK